LGVLAEQRKLCEFPHLDTMLRCEHLVGSRLLIQLDFQDPAVRLDGRVNVFFGVRLDVSIE
jgi:hypothetical protein